MARDTDTSRWFNSATDDDIQNLISDLQNENLSEESFREKYPFSSGATRPYLKDKNIFVKIKGKSSSTTLSSPEIDYSKVTTISPDDIERVNTYLSKDTIKRLEKALQGRKPISRAVFMDKAINYALDVLEGSGGIIAINEIPSSKQKKKPGRKPTK